MKRILTLLCVLMLTVTGIDFGGFGFIQEAFAEAVSDDTSLPAAAQTPAPVSSGSWVYYVNDAGFATITGYLDPAVTSLRIPREIDGIGVSAIASGAFLNQSALTSLTVPTSVSSLGEGLFANPSAVTIRAYNGSPALIYARQQGLRSANQSSMDFSGDVVDLSGTPNSAFSFGGGQLVINRLDAAAIQVGDVVYAQGRDKYYQNYLAGCVQSISVSGDKAIITYREAELYEWLSSIHYDLSNDDSAMWEITAVGEDVELDIPIGAAKRFEKSGSKSMTIPAKVQNVAGGKLTGSITLSYNVFVDATAQWDWPPVRVDKVEASVTATTNLKFVTTKSYDKEKFLFTVTLWSKPGIKVRCDVYAVIDFEGKVTIEVKDVYQVGLKYKNGGGVSAYGYHTPVKRTVDIDATIRAGIKPVIMLEVLGYDIAHVSGVLGLRFEAKLKAVQKCLNIKVYFYGKVEAGIDILKKSTGWKKLVDKKITEMHFEDGKKVSSCTRGDKKITFVSNGGTSFSPLTVQWGQRATFKSVCYRKGYTFAGWYTDKACTKKWSWSTPVTKNITLYAKWVKNSGSRSTSKDGEVALQTPTPTPTGLTAAATATPAPTLPPVTGIELDASECTMYTMEDGSTRQLVATVLPAMSDDPRVVVWSSSDESVVCVDDWGNLIPIQPGQAVITCTVLGNSDVTASCTVTVLQRAMFMILDTSYEEITSGEQFQIVADVYPEETSDRAVLWTSSDPAVATVDENGVVTGVGAGSAIITATAADGSGVYEECAVDVTQAFGLNGAIGDHTFYYSDSSDEHVQNMLQPAGSLGTIGITGASALRMAQQGLGLTWTLSSSGDGASAAELLTYDSTVVVEDESLEVPVATVVITDLLRSGSDEYTLTATAGDYTAQTTFTVNVEELSGDYATRVTLATTTFEMAEGGTVTIPSCPIRILGGSVVLENLALNIVGDALFDVNAEVAETDDGLAVTIGESGQYQATAVYTTANLRYEVALTFRVTDGDGMVNLPVNELQIDADAAQLVSGETLQLHAAVYPEDAYNRGVVWTSQDESVATVSGDGLVTAVAAGRTVIICTAADGSEVADYCTITVEDLLQLAEDEIVATVYMDGDVPAWLEGVSLTYDSAERLAALGLTPVWTVTRNSGDAAEIAIEEVDHQAGADVIISGHIIHLLRLNHAGTDQYTVTCTAGTQSVSLPLTIHVAEASLPDAVTLPQTAFTLPVGEPVTLDMNIVTTPAGMQLPEDTMIWLTGSKAFGNAMDPEQSGEWTYAFLKPGAFTAEMLFTGSNYTYAVPLTFTVSDEAGQVPVAVESISLARNSYTLLTGESVREVATVLPANATDPSLTWTSYDPEIATVTSDGQITAVAAGETYISVTSVSSDVVALCRVVVEDGLTMNTAADTLTVYLEGTTRTELQRYYLSEGSSQRIDGQEVTWTLQRVSGDNLTLSMSEASAVNENGVTLQGAAVSLYSVSRTGTTVYDLICTVGGQSAVTRLTVNVVNRDDVIPASISLRQDVFSASVGELITIVPDVVCWPDNTRLPDQIRVSMVGSDAFNACVNAEDFHVSRTQSTVSFAEPGLYEAEIVYAHSNVAYHVPVTFRIADESGAVPVRPQGMTLNATDVFLLAGESIQLAAVFQPADTTNRAVTWTSSDPAVATVTADGLVSAVSNGYARITCTPADPLLLPRTCYITVEDRLAVSSGRDAFKRYIQGDQTTILTTAWLSTGTLERLLRAGITPEWSLECTGDCADVWLDVVENGAKAHIRTTSLRTAGTDTYVLRCTAGEDVWEQTITLQLIDLVAEGAPETLTISNQAVTAAVGETIRLDFTPVCEPAGTTLPEDFLFMPTFAGLADFYDKLDYSVYMEDGDAITLAFTEPGVYLLTRQYAHLNMRYTALCTITVGEAQHASLLKCDQTEYTVYQNSQAAVAGPVTLKGAMIAEAFGDSLTWKVERISGNSTLAGLRVNEDSSASLVIADVRSTGTDVWRLSCTVAGQTDYVDLTVHAVIPRSTIPQSIAIAQDHLQGMMGNWLTAPLGVVCQPEGSALPESGDAFWTLSMNDYSGQKHAEWRIENGTLRIRFSQSGYYGATLTYQAGNVSYSIPMYFTILNEESVVARPEGLHLRLAGCSTVYPEGSVNVPVADVRLADDTGSYTESAAAAYADAHGATWEISVTDGSACALSISQAAPGYAVVSLEGINAPGDVTYTIRCTVNGETFTATGTLHVASADEARPDPTLTRSSYQTMIGQPLMIDPSVHEKGDSSYLHSASVEDWSNESALAAMGYQVDETDGKWAVTFYEEGTYQTYVDVLVGNLVCRMPLSIRVYGEGGTEILHTMKMPTALTVIGREAFAATSVNVLDLRGSRVHTIEAKAFSGCTDLMKAYIPATVTSIADNAFYGCLNLVIVCEPGSYADTFAQKNNIPTEYMQ